MRGVTWVAVLAGLLLGGIGRADTYWIAFEFNDPNDLPPYSGWARHFSPPSGANPSVADGVLTYDSNDPQTYDYNEYHRPGALDPGPNEVFMIEWKLWTECVSYWGDPGICVGSDDAWAINLVFDVDVIHSFHEYVDIPIPPGDWHSYALISADMRAYDLYIDGVLARHGWFAHRFIKSFMDWGDGVQGEASRHHWDFFRFGVLAAPLTGDVNCDGSIDFGDINPFVQALTDPGGYEAAYPGCPSENADINADGIVDFGDINPFVELLTAR